MGLVGVVLTSSVLSPAALAQLALVLRELLAAVGTARVTRLVAGLAAVLEIVRAAAGLGRRALRARLLVLEPLALRLLSPH